MSAAAEDESLPALRNPPVGPPSVAVGGGASGSVSGSQSAASSVLTAPPPRVALITGITGQDGAYLTELLLSKGYVVHGIVRRASAPNLYRLERLYRNDSVRGTWLRLHYADMSDLGSLMNVLRRAQPDEIYNLAAQVRQALSPSSLLTWPTQSAVRTSFEQPEHTANVDGLGTLRLLEALRFLGLEKRTRVYQASTSELFGNAKESPQTERTPFYPRSPYAVSKLFGYWTIVNYREAYGMFAVNGIMFNHESPLRGVAFVTRKITHAVVAIKNNRQECLYLGNLSSLRDWGHAKDFVHAVWLMLQHSTPEDFVLATGEQHSVRDFCDAAFSVVDMTITWEGHGVDEVGRCKETGKIVVRVDPQFFRPTEVDNTVGDPRKAETVLGWKRQFTFKELVRDMVEHDIRVFGHDEGNQLE